VTPCPRWRASPPQTTGCATRRGPFPSELRIGRSAASDSEQHRAAYSHALRRAGVDRRLRLAPGRPARRSRSRSQGRSRSFPIRVGVAVRAGRAACGAYGLSAVSAPLAGRRSREIVPVPAVGSSRPRPNVKEIGMALDRRAGRDVLPIPDRRYAGLITDDAKDPDTSFPAVEPLRPPAGAPNVLIVLLDDVGFGASSAFGGPTSTPTAERLAASGLKYNRFHTTALCSPTRQALLTGRNHHSGQRVHRNGQLAADRHRRSSRGPRPPHHPGGAAQHRDVAPIERGPHHRAAALALLRAPHESSVRPPEWIPTRRA
jgi:hypothetical protein